MDGGEAKSNDDVMKMEERCDEKYEGDDYVVTVRNVEMREKSDNPEKIMKYEKG